MTRQRISRSFTQTPLVRLFSRRFEKGGSKIPWEKFDLSRYSPPALALFHDAVCALAAGEYAAIELFSRLTAALARIGAPFDIVGAAATIPVDELRHANLALKMASLCGPREGVSFDTSLNDSRWPERPDILDLDLVMLELAAIGETLALALLSACAHIATDPVARGMYRSIVADELHHARLGWYYLAWRSPSWTQRERQRVADRAGELIVGVEARFAMGRDAPRGARKDARALGVLDSRVQARVVRSVMATEIVPALDSFGLGASLAWRLRETIRPL